MTNSFNVEVQGIDKAKAALTSAGAGIIAALNASMQKATFDLVGYVKAQKLSGQSLNVRTGRLRRSINGKVDDTGSLITSSVGTNVSYGAFWEYGFKGVQPVKAHVRNIKSVFGKPLKNPVAVQVRAHDRKLDVQPRPFITPAIEERFPTYAGWFAKAVEEGARNGTR